jgi:hypothetical protein
MKRMRVHGGAFYFFVAVLHCHGILLGTDIDIYCMKRTVTA